MFGLEEFGFISDMSQALQQKIDIIGNLVEKPFATLSFEVRQILQCFSTVSVEKWEYITDPETGLKVLESKDDPEALKRVRKLADALLK
jgi:hypothetical protein